jgi:hypothetical protein
MTSSGHVNPGAAIGLTSPVRIRTRSALGGPAFSQAAADRRGEVRRSDRGLAVASPAGTGEWAIIEVVSHLADTEERALTRVRRMLAEDSPFLEPFDQEALAEQRGYLDLDLQGELARLEELRRQHVAELVALELL